MSDILVESRGAIATVVFNRPRMRDAISLAMWGEIARVTEGLAKDDSIRAIVYRRQTEGADFAIRDRPKPTVAMIYGYYKEGTRAFLETRPPRFQGR